MQDHKSKTIWSMGRLIILDMHLKMHNFLIKWMLNQQAR